MNLIPFLLILIGLSVLGTLLVVAASFLLAKFLDYNWFLPHKQKLHDQKPSFNQANLEYNQQFVSVFFGIFFGYGSLFAVVLQDFSKLYYIWHQHSWLWLILTLPAMILLSDLYIYTLHRLMHVRHLLPFHKLHHFSTKTNVSTAYSLHVLESIFYTLFLTFFVLIFPTHILNFLIFMAITIMYNFYIHSGYDLFLGKSTFFGFWNTASLHHVHHTKHQYNFGFYTTFWDKLFGTHKKF